MRTRRGLVEARMRRGWSQDSLAAKIGVRRETVSQWERGAASPYPVHTQALCELFDMSTEELGLCNDIICTSMNASSKLWNDDLLDIYDRGITACRDLFFDGHPHPISAILPLYCSQTAMLAKEASPLQRPAAKLASHAQRLASELAIDREDFGHAEQAGKDAFLYAQLAEDVDLQVAALIILANLAFHRKLSTAALAAYQQAVSLLSDEVTPLLHGRTYAGLAEVYAMRGNLQDAMRAIGKAYEVYPQVPENDPAYPYTRASRYALYVFGDVQSRLFLNQPKEADRALAVMRNESSDPEFEPITKLDMLYYQADIQVQQGNLESSQAVLTEAAQLSKELGSRLYFNKLAVTFYDLQRKLPREPRVQAMEEVFQPW